MPASVLIAGGGVGALETVLALQALASDRVELTLLAPGRHFVYRPLAVDEPFGGARVLRFPLREFAEDRGVRLVRDAVAAVEPSAREVRTQGGARVPFDVLVLATGARALEAIPGALTFRGPSDVGRMRDLVDEVRAGAVAEIAFVVQPGATWSLPLYELAFATAVAAREAGVPARLCVVTPERAPVEVLGPAASAEVTGLLEAHGIALQLTSTAIPVSADRVVALPRLVGRRIAGVPADERDFTPVDLFGRVRGVDRVYAVGDGTDCALKQGGLAAQQADTAAASIAATFGALDVPAPFAPVVRGALLADDIVRNLRSAGGGAPASVSDVAPWSPGAKIDGGRLAPYLAAHLLDAEVPAPA